MLQEYWASAVIFIGIFSQCGDFSATYKGLSLRRVLIFSTLLAVRAYSSEFPDMHGGK